jgi:putative phosphoesterase
MKIGLISDTHGYVDEQILQHLSTCDEIWHAGDFGTLQVSDSLTAVKPLRGVYGNIDDSAIRILHPKNQRFSCAGLNVYMTHIGGYPGRYNPDARKEIQLNPPQLFICGHSHILKIMPDKSHGLLHINPGAAGRHGFHKVRTLITFIIKEGKITELKVIELGKRA